MRKRAVKKALFLFDLIFRKLNPVKSKYNHEEGY
jgi:hypothetical protein